MLDLGHQPDHASGARPRLLQQVEQVDQSKDRLLPVEGGRALPELRQPLTRAQRRQLGPVEVLGEPAGELLPVDDLGGASVGELTMSGSTASAPIAIASS